MSCVTFMALAFKGKPCTQDDGGQENAKWKGECPNEWQRSLVLMGGQSEGTLAMWGEDAI